MIAKSNKFFIILLLVLVGFTLYVNSFQNQMFWDDDDFILNNKFVHEWRYAPKYFSENLIAGAGLLSNYWRPMLLSVFSLEWHLWSDWPAGYHLVNTLFHVANAVLLFFIVLCILKFAAKPSGLKSSWLAGLVSLLFLVHPLQTEAVTYVSGLGDSLSVFFIFLGMLCYLKFRISKKAALRSWLYFASLFMYALALMSKEAAIIMPFLILLVDFFFFNFSQAKLFQKQRLKKILKAVWPFFALACLYVLLRATALNFINTFNLYNEETLFTANFHVRLFTFFKILLVYVGLLFWPMNLHMERTVTIAVSFFSWPVISGCLIFLGLMFLAVKQARKWPMVSFGVLWFFIGLAPVSNLLVPINGLLYEHWLYLPMIGVFLALLWFVIKIAARYKLQKVLLVIAIALLLFFSVLTVNRNQDWRSPISFYQQTLKYAPNSYRVLNNLGMAFAKQGDLKTAEKMYRQAINLTSSSAVAYYNLANLYKDLGEDELAKDNFSAAIEADPKFVFAYNGLANFYLQGRQYQKAREIFEQYLNHTDSKVNTLLLLTQIALEEKNFEVALSYLENAFLIEPQNQIVQRYITNIARLIDLKE